MGLYRGFDGKFNVFYLYSDNWITNSTEATVFGWGHAVANDLVSWQEKELLFMGKPNSNVLYGSVVSDIFNTSGFSTGDPQNPPYVAIYTRDEGAPGNPQYTQNLVLSRDGGKTWENYAHNPVIKFNKDRNLIAPKVFWYTKVNKWVMVATSSNQGKVFFS